MRATRRRLDRSFYVGFRLCFLTFCTSRRVEVFRDRDFVDVMLREILRTAGAFDMSVTAYCFMPDHLHLLVEGCSGATDLTAFVHQAKQRTAFVASRSHNIRLWQPSYYDRLLRDEDATISVARYVIENPVRAGLVASPQDYPFLGSQRYTLDEILDAIRWQP
jgi:putative transposase